MFDRARGGAAAMLAVSLLASPAAASGPEWAGQGLPPGLVLDETNLLALPAGAALMDPRILIQHGTSSTYRDPFTGELVIRSIEVAEPYGLVMAGSGSRVGYVFDDNTHGVLFASGAFGVSLSYEESSTVDEDLDFRFRENGIDDEILSKTYVRSAVPRLRLGAGWATRTGGGRLFEIGLGGAWLKSEVRAFSENILGVRYDTGWTGDAGWEAGAWVRTLQPRHGLQFSASFTHQDKNADYRMLLFPARDRFQSASVDLGWRQPVDILDDLVLGAIARWWSWGQSAFSSTTSIDEQRQANTKEVLAGVFVGLEKDILPDLAFRGGLVGSGRWTSTESYRFTRFDNDEAEDFIVDGRQARDWSVAPPSARLGLSGTWKGFTADVQFDQRISLTSPFVSWALSHPL